MKDLIIAREREQAVFERLLNEPTAQMQERVAVAGYSEG